MGMGNARIMQNEALNNNENKNENEGKIKSKWHFSSFVKESRHSTSCISKKESQTGPYNVVQTSLLCLFHCFLFISVHECCAGSRTPRGIIVSLIQMTRMQRYH